MLLRHAFGKRAGEQLGVPVFLYEHATGIAAEDAEEHPRYYLSDIRAGEYEALSSRITQQQWKPDFGPAEFVPSWGATAAGARKFLIAYNVNLLGTKQQAVRIALNVREQGRGPGKEGRLSKVKGIGWYVDEYGMAQISLNILDHDVTPVHTAYEAVVEEARNLGLGVVGSEIVGLVPLDVMQRAADYYCQRDGLFVLDEAQRVRLATERLGLNSVSPFIPEKRIVEYMCRDQQAAEPLASLSTREFVQVLGARTAAPGGGSAAALVASMGAGLGAMMGWMTFGSKKWEALDGKMRELIRPMHEAMHELIPMIDADTNAFNEYMDAMKLPAGSEERRAAEQAGLRSAINVPLRVMRIGDAIWPDMHQLAEHGNMSSVSDLEAGARCLELGIWGAWRNVVVNMGDIDEGQWKTDVMEEAQHIVDRAQAESKKVLDTLEQRAAS